MVSVPVVNVQSHAVGARQRALDNSNAPRDIGSVVVRRPRSPVATAATTTQSPSQQQQQQQR